MTHDDATSLPFAALARAAARRPRGLGMSHADPARPADPAADSFANSFAETDPGLAEAARRVSGMAPAISDFLKVLSHDGRLALLCHLAQRPRSVTELENLLSSRQATVSQQLARLRHEGLVRARREGQAIFYSLHDERVARAITLLAELFAPTEPAGRGEGAGPD